MHYLKYGQDGEIIYITTTRYPKNMENYTEITKEEYDAAIERIQENEN